MTSWHEISRIRGGLSRFSADHRTRQVVRRSETDPAVFEAHYVRQQKRGPHPPPEECVELWPNEPIAAPTAREAVNKAAMLLEAAASGAQDSLFHLRPCPIPIQRKKVAEIDSPTHQAVAWICRHAGDRYEVRYFGALVGCDWDDGWRLPPPPAESEKVPDGFEVLTIADGYESAEKVALAELERIAATEKVKPRKRVQMPYANCHGGRHDGEE